MVNLFMSCELLCSLFANINWLWYIIAVIIVFGVGCLWYAKLFTRLWMEAYDIKMPATDEKPNMLPSMLLQLIATALLGLVFFIVTPMSVWLAVIVLVGFAVWQKASLRFRISNTKQFIKAAGIDVGYMCVAAIIFILFALF